jgi:osmoprotectant transport system permease protein
LDTLLLGTLEYIDTHQAAFLAAIQRHLLLFVIVLLISVAIGVPLGMASAKRPIFSAWALNIFSALKMIPSLALLMVFIPILGVGFLPAMIALIVHALPTILINTYTGYSQIDEAILENATAMGLTEREILWRVETPLALPLIFSGLRTSSVDIIATTTVAAYIGAGGLGEFVIVGITNMNSVIMLAGSLTVAAIALIVDFIFSLLQRRLIRYQIA